MTHTLHRRGSEEALQGDYVVLTHVAKGLNEEGSGEKAKRIVRIFLKYDPVVFGVGTKAWLDPEGFIESLEDGKGVSATFTDIDTVRQVVREIRDADLGLSVNVTGLVDEVREMCESLGFEPHAAECSLGQFGQTDRLPSRPILEINSLCGHGMVTFNLIKKVVDQIKLGEMTPQQGADLMKGCCQCGCFNTERAAALLGQARVIF